MMKFKRQRWIFAFSAAIEYLNRQSVSATIVERVSSPNHFAELQLTGIEPATLVTGPSNSTTELSP